MTTEAKVAAIRQEIARMIDYVATCENAMKNAPDTYRPNFDHIANTRAKIQAMTQTAARMDRADYLQATEHFDNIG
jgi:hypothetical protein|tara:strand:- start:311 stop:538 length:228 start_codon:yes stop_codon:yes gene_type:complete